MNILQTRKVATGIFALGAMLFVALIIPSSSAFAATKTWTGGGSNDNFSTAANWSDTAAPVAGDDLVFPGTESLYLNNDLSLTFGSLTFSDNARPSPATSVSYSIDGNLTVSGAVSIGQDAYVSLEGISITQDAVVTVDPVSTLNLENVTIAGHKFTVQAENFSALAPGSAKPSANVLIDGAISDAAGAILAFNGVSLDRLESTNSDWVALLSFNKSVFEVDDDTVLGADASAIELVDSQLGTSLSAELTINKPISINRNLYGLLSRDATSFGDEAISVFGGTANAHLVLAGSVTLLSDILIDPYTANLIITGPFSGNHLLGVTQAYSDTSGGHIVVNSSANTTPIPNGDYIIISQANATLDGDAISQSIIIQIGSTATINGSRGYTIISPDAVIMGTGTLAGLNVLPGGTVAPGTSPGILNAGPTAISGNLVIELGGTTVGSEYDQLNVNGTVNLIDATLRISYLNGFSPASGAVFTIINNDGQDAVAGEFANLAEGTEFNVEGVTYKISYVGGDGNDVTLTVVGGAVTAPNTGVQSIITSSPVLVAVLGLAAAGTVIFLAVRRNATK